MFCVFGISGALGSQELEVKDGQFVRSRPAEFYGVSGFIPARSHHMTVFSSRHQELHAG